MTMQQRFWAILHKVLPYWALRRVCDLCAEFGFDPRGNEFDRRLAAGEVRWTVNFKPAPGGCPLFIVNPSRTFSTGTSITYTYKG